MNTKFIGLEGFCEIESISSQTKSSKNNDLSFARKSVRFVKRAITLFGRYAVKRIKRLTLKTNTKTLKRRATSKSVKPFSVIDKHYKENRAADRYEISVREVISNVSYRNVRRHAHSAPQPEKHSILRRKAVPTIAASVLAVTMTCFTAVGALSGENNAMVNKITNPASPVNYNEFIDVDDYSNYPLASSVSNEGAFSENMVYESVSTALSDVSKTNCFAGLYIDGELIGVAEDAVSISTALDKVLEDYIMGYDDTTTAEFVNKVEVKEGEFDKSDLISIDALIGLASAKLSISLSTDIIYTQEIPYSSTVEYDDSETTAYEKVKTEGVNGEGKFVVKTTYVDGVQTDAVTTECITVKEPIDEVIIKGSKEEPAVGNATGYFIWPLPYTDNITSTFGDRWGTTHGGIDISSSGVYGESVIAADGGTVTFAGDRDDGYGYYVIIDHGNGYQTYYAHCSSLAVSTGEAVAQGQTIGYVGSTGYSTGPHLHFEIRIDDSQVDPLGYVG